MKVSKVPIPHPIKPIQNTLVISYKNLLIYSSVYDMIISTSHTKIGGAYFNLRWSLMKLKIGLRHMIRITAKISTPPAPIELLVPYSVTHMGYLS
jgi:hypothetical protein